MKKFYLFMLGLSLPFIAIAGLETGTYISDLVVTNPTGVDDYATADDHIRLIKSTVKNTFPNIDGAAAATDEELSLLTGLTATATELNTLDGVAATLTSTELNTLDGITATSTELNLLDGITGTIWSSDNDGTASTLDADLLDGNSSAFYQNAGNINAGELNDARLSSNVPLITQGTFTLNISFGCDVPVAPVIDYTKVGPLVVWNIPQTECDGDQELLVLLSDADVPVTLRPSADDGDVVALLTVLDNETALAGCMNIKSTGTVEFAPISGDQAVTACGHDGWTAGGDRGFAHITVTYSVGTP